MTVARDLITELRQRHIHVEARGDKLRLRPTPPHHLIEKVCQHKADVLALLWTIEQERAVIHFRLPGYAPGESADSVAASLLDRWPNVEVDDGRRIFSSQRARAYEFGHGVDE